MVCTCTAGCGVEVVIKVDDELIRNLYFFLYEERNLWD